MTVTSAPHRSGYRAADVVLRDGSTAHVRPVQLDDEAALLAFYEKLSDESRALRFFTAAADVSRQAEREVRQDNRAGVGLVASTGAASHLVGHAQYAGEPGSDRAEAAVAIADEMQGHGLATILLGQLAEIARANGIRTIEADVLRHNWRMLGVFRESGFPLEMRSAADHIRVSFPTSLTEDALERFERREQIAAASALAGLLVPRSVAVVGASRDATTPGGAVFHNLLAYGFTGPVYPVNQAASAVQSVLAYPDVAAIPGPVDLAVIAVPAARVLEVADQCGRKGIRGLIVLSAGFAEVGAAGWERQAELLRVCRRTGMRLIGPNSIGAINTDPAVRLDAIFGPHLPPHGRVGFASQSGALGLATIDYASERGIGISSFVSMGNKADISGNDLLNYWETDPSTDVILLYLESFGNPRKFSRIARRVGRQKPIVVVKSGRSTAGARASSSHTGVLLGTSDVTVDALFRQCGVIRTDSLAGLFDVTTLLAHQPVPSGRRVGIVTNVGGPGIMCADACDAEGLDVPPLADATLERLRALLPPEASLSNPVDMIASATAEQYRQAIAVVAADPEIDAIITIFIPPLATRTDDVAGAIASASQETGTKPVLAVFMSSAGIKVDVATGRTRIPTYQFPEAAALALAHAARYGEWRSRPASSVPELAGLRREEAAAIASKALAAGAGWLDQDDVVRLLGCYGLPSVEQRVVCTAEEAGRAAEVFGGRVALKAIASGLLHKSDAGAVRLDLHGEGATREAAQAIADALASAGQPLPTGFLVQRMVPPGVEMLVGVAHDPRFGPVLACGAGGVLVELLKDVSVRLSPLSSQDAREMVREVKSFPLLRGYRGRPPADVTALEDILLRVSALVEDRPEIAEMDLNPVVVGEHGATIVDARIRVEAAEPPLPLGARQ